MTIPGKRSSRRIFRPRMSAVPANGVRRQAREPTAIRLHHDRPARSPASAAVIFRIQRVLPAGGDRSRARHRPGADHHNPAARRPAAINPRAVRAAVVRRSRLRHRIPRRAIVRRARSAPAAQDHAAGGRRKCYAAEPSHESRAAPPKSSGSSRASIPACSAAAVLIVRGWICVRRPASSVSRRATRKAARGIPFQICLRRTRRRRRQRDRAQRRRHVMRRPRNAFAFRSVRSNRGQRYHVRRRSRAASQY